MAQNPAALVGITFSCSLFLGSPGLINQVFLLLLLNAFSVATTLFIDETDTKRRKKYYCRPHMGLKLQCTVTPSPPEATVAGKCCG